MVQLNLVISAAIICGVLPGAIALVLPSSPASLEAAHPGSFEMNAIRGSEAASKSKRSDGSITRDTLPVKPNGTFDFDEFVAFAQQAASKAATSEMKAWAEAIANVDCEMNKAGGYPCLTLSAPDLFLKIVTDGSKDQDPYAVEILINFLRWRKSSRAAPTGAQLNLELYTAVNSWEKHDS